MIASISFSLSVFIMLSVAHSSQPRSLLRSWLRQVRSRLEAIVTRNLKCTKDAKREFLLLNCLNCLGTDLLILDLRGIPAASQRFHQVNGHYHLLAQELRLQSLVREQG